MDEVMNDPFHLGMDFVMNALHRPQTEKELAEIAHRHAQANCAAGRHVKGEVMAGAMCVYCGIVM